MQELDRRRAWERKGAQLDAADLAAKAFHAPPKLNDERHDWLASARAGPSISPKDLLSRGERIARFIRKGQVLVS